MDDDKFDVIVVGGGISGCTCALLLAQAGINVLLLERATQPGGKNVSGGRLYSYSLETIIPQFAKKAPLERQITHEKLSLLSHDSATTLDYQHPPFSTATTSYSVLRARFDPWLMSQAENAGAQCLTGVQVDSLVIENGIICGVHIGEDKLYARSVVLAEGANTLLCEQHKLMDKPQPHSMGIGVKEVLALPQSKIEERFSLENNQGTAWLFAGEATSGQSGGGFLYTNRDTLSFGLVCNLSSLGDAKQTLPQMLENFKQHPVMRPLLKDSELLEYSAHLIPESGLNDIPSLVGSGYLIIGDAARLCINCGYTVRGMDLSILSAKAAAQTLIDALQNNSVISPSLKHYQTHLENSAIWSLLKQNKSLPEMLLHNPRLFRDYPQITSDTLKDLFEISHGPTIPLRKTLWKNVRRIGFFNLIKDVIQAGRCL